MGDQPSRVLGDGATDALPGITSEPPPASKSVETLKSRNFLSASIRALSLCSAR